MPVAVLAPMLISLIWVTVKASGKIEYLETEFYDPLAWLRSRAWLRMWRLRVVNSDMRAFRPHLTRPGPGQPIAGRRRHNRPDLGQRHRHNRHPTGVVPPR